jgi:biopolymer transport protein ExbD
MSDERRSEGGGAAVAVVVIVLILGFVGLLAVGGVGAFFYARSSQQMAMVSEARAMAEMERAHAAMAAAEMNEQLAKAAAERAVAAADNEAPAKAVPEILLEIDAAGQFTLADKTLSFEELKDVLLAEHFDKGPELQLVITAALDTPYKRVAQAVEAAECASITKHRIKPPAVVAAEAAPPPTSQP